PVGNGGTPLRTRAGRARDGEGIARWAARRARLRQMGRRTILVSSGAIAEGMQRLGWTRRPHSMHELQAAAAVGQMGLVQCYESCFREHGLHTAQVLLTHADMADRQRHLNALPTRGMLTKVQAAKRAARSGAHTVIASGREPEVLVRLAQGERLGTLLTAQTVPLAARKQWLADHLTVTGRLRLDAGAVKAVV